ncbi:MAG: PilZ domain-containing protein [Elusimicrobia bacterium]|nr:PilZ domain-containing protein [Elusimicrobiota bacterium]
MINEIYTGTERRQTLRIKFEGSGEIRCQTSGDSMLAETCSFINLSEKGACLKAPIPLNENTELALHFKLPGLLNINLNSTAKVIWCLLQPEEKCYLIGVTFHSIKAMELTALRSFILIQNKKGNILQS